MNLDDITPELVEQALKALRQNEDPPDSLLTLDFLAVYRTRAERIYAFNQWMTAAVDQQLTRCRRLLRVPSISGAAGTEQLKAIVQEDFKPQNINLEAWSALYHRYIEADFMLDVSELAAASGQYEKQFRRRVQVGVRKLTYALRETEQHAHQLNHAAYLRAGLHSPDYRLLYGIHHLQSHLMRQLIGDAGPRFISLEGMGGIGKTALARATAEALAEEQGLAGLIWISARSERLTPDGIVPEEEAARTLEDVVNQLWQKLGMGSAEQIRTADKLLQLAPVLANRRYLIVVDNLETVADSQLLPPQLFPLAGASRFLVTSRESLSTFAFVETYSVPELSSQDSAALVTSEVERLSQGSVALTGADLERIYASVGGVPLALKLIAAQAVVLPVERCLENLHTVGDRRETLFEYIYRQTWRLLSDSSRRLLFALHDTITPDGAGLRWLSQMGMGVGLSPEAFTTALAELSRYSLLDISGAADDRHYRLHRLTITFLQNEFRRKT